MPERFVTHVLADLKHYDLHTVLIPAVKTLHGELVCTKTRVSYKRQQQFETDTQLLAELREMAEA